MEEKLKNVEKETLLQAAISKFSIDECEKIMKVCKANKIEIAGSVFLRTSKQLKENVEYINENFGKEYILPLIVSKSKKNLEKVLPFLKEKGVLTTLKTSASILYLTKEEIEDRMRYLEKHKQPFIVDNGKKMIFDSVFGLSRKKYKELVEKNNEIVR